MGLSPTERHLAYFSHSHLSTFYFKTLTFGKNGSHLRLRSKRVSKVPVYALSLSMLNV